MPTHIGFYEIHEEIFIHVPSAAIMWPLRDCSRVCAGDAAIPIGASTTPPLNAAAGYMMTSIVVHRDLHTRSRTKFWSARELWFVDAIANSSVVLDVGAGSMHLSESLAAAKSSVTYIPVDAVQRGHPRMRICRLHLHEFPLSVKPTPTVLVFQGVFEYVYDKVLFLKVMRCAYPRATMLMSYAVGHKVGVFASKGWAAPLTWDQLLGVFDALALNLTSFTRNCDPATHQVCMRVSPLQRHEAALKDICGDEIVRQPWRHAPPLQCQ